MDCLTHMTVCGVVFNRVLVLPTQFQGNLVHFPIARHHKAGNLVSLKVIDVHRKPTFIDIDRNKKEQCKVEDTDIYIKLFVNSQRKLSMRGFKFKCVLDSYPIDIKISLFLEGL